jgi:hypothetical protein
MDGHEVIWPASNNPLLRTQGGRTTHIPILHTSSSSDNVWLKDVCPQSPRLGQLSKLPAKLTLVMLTDLPKRDSNAELESAGAA